MPHGETTSKARSFAEKLEAYAKLIIVSGCNIQPGQDLQISCAVECVDLARALARQAYAAGAHRVWTRYADETIARMTYEHCTAEDFATFPAWSALQNNTQAQEGCAMLSITSEDPEALTGIDPTKLIANARASHKACKEFYDCLDFGRTVWCIAGGASPAWAHRVFPDDTADEALSRLWNAIFHTARADGDDPIADWERHKASFAARMDVLNGYHLDRLHYENALGTDLTVGLPPQHYWKGGGDTTTDGIYFFPNMPTEEIFTSPDRTRTDGLVFASLPLVHNGAVIEDFWLRFEKGAVVDFGAKRGYDVLESIVEVDEGSRYLGEAALVEYTSPIRQTGILFYNTLFDENASCHLALGKGFPDCYEGGMDLDEATLLEAGVNTSAAHVDFMVGTDDLHIDGITRTGETVPVFDQGVFAF